MKHPLTIIVIFATVTYIPPAYSGKYETIKRRMIEAYGLVVSKPLGFNNTYAIGINTPYAQKHNLTKISDLAKVPDIKIAFSHTFLKRDDKMSELNAMVDVHNKTFTEAAQSFLADDSPPNRSTSLLWQLTGEHLILVLISIFGAILIGIPFGILGAKFDLIGQVVLVVSGLLQTIPSLALLCFLIPLFGIGYTPALVALFLYALLPIVRGTYSGLISIPPRSLETAKAMGLTPAQTLWRIELPLSSISIMSGIKTSTVINVGTATLAAFIGAGGYGTLIVTGLSLNSNTIILKGAIPAAIMAILFHGFFEVADRIIIPKGLRIRPR